MKDKEDKKDFASDPEIQEQMDIRKIKQKAFAFLKRGEQANIPKKHLRINCSDFADILDAKYIKDNIKEYKNTFGDDYSAKNPKDFASYLYDNADKILKMDYIIIDGGNSDARRRAGYALLFRLILCDKWGLYKECNELSHIFQTIQTTDGTVHRNSLATELKRYDVLFLAEFYKQLMNAHFETGTFFDEVLVARRFSDKLTIISFSEDISDENKITNKDYGVTLADLSWQIKPRKQILRIKVKPYEPK